MSDEKALVVIKSQGIVKLEKPSNPKELIEYHESVSQLIREALVEGTDYGKIPGTEKNTLLKAGAERLCLAFGVIQKYTILSSEVDHDRQNNWEKDSWNKWKKAKEHREGKSLGLYRYVVQCELLSRSTGDLLGTQAASCSTMEAKYVEKPRDHENTTLKMAQKRALVGATMNAFGLSDRFTQDAEDIDIDNGDRTEKSSSQPPKNVDKEETISLYNRAMQAGVSVSEWSSMLKEVGQKRKGEPLTEFQRKVCEEKIALLKKEEPEIAGTEIVSDKFEGEEYADRLSEEAKIPIMDYFQMKSRAKGDAKALVSMIEEWKTRNRGEST
jgi:hypothetical protein